MFIYTTILYLTEQGLDGVGAETGIADEVERGDVGLALSVLGQIIACASYEDDAIACAICAVSAALNTSPARASRVGLTHPPCGFTRS